ncbi:hypothetical protein D3C85_846150 [compost metagenome]
MLQLLIRDRRPIIIVQMIMRCIIYQEELELQEVFQEVRLLQDISPLDKVFLLKRLALEQ